MITNDPLDPMAPGRTTNLGADPGTIPDPLSTSTSYQPGNTWTLRIVAAVATLLILFVVVEVALK